MVTWGLASRETAMWRAYTDIAHVHRSAACSGLGRLATRSVVPDAVLVRLWRRAHRLNPMIEWGTFPDWGVMSFTGAGFGAAFYQLRLSRLEQRHERARAVQAQVAEREAMARSVGIKINWGTKGTCPKRNVAQVEVVNASPFPIDAVVLVIEGDEFPLEIVFGTMLPGERVADFYESGREEVVFGELTSGAHMLFTDTHGDHWARYPGHLERREFMARMC